MLFSQRLRLIKSYQEWIAEINKNKDYVLQETFVTFLVYLDSHGLLNEDKISERDGMNMAEDFKQLKQQIAEIDDKLQELHNRRYDLTDKLHMTLQEKLKCTVGICLKKGEKYYKITGVPEPYFATDCKRYFNEYRLPALVIDTEDKEIFKDTIFTHAADADDPVEQLYNEYEKCSESELSTVLHDIFDYFGISPIDN